MLPDEEESLSEPDTVNRSLLTVIPTLGGTAGFPLPPLATKTGLFGGIGGGVPRPIDTDFRVGPELCPIWNDIFPPDVLTTVVPPALRLIRLPDDPSDMIRTSEAGLNISPGDIGRFSGDEGE